MPSDPATFFLPEDIDDTMYEDLLLEIPELRGRLRLGENRTLHEYAKMPYLRNSKNVSYEVAPNEESFDRDKDDDQEEYRSQLDHITVTHKATASSTAKRLLLFLARRPPTSANFSEPQNLTASALSWGKRVKIASCYWCGLNYPERLPSNSLCHDAFESPDWRARTMARYLRARCFKHYTYHSEIEPHKFSEWTTYTTDRGLVRAQYGPWWGGCFKRFLDVGTMHTQRGCRSWWPKYSNTPSFVTHRYTRLEALLKHKSEYCVVSPQASLTPFSRAVSLFVRYHVCVCSGRYCNAGPRGAAPGALAALAALAVLAALFILALN